MLDGNLKPVFEMYEMPVDDLGFNTALSREQLARVEALWRAREILMNRGEGKAFGAGEVRLPNTGDMVYLSEWILGYAMVDEDDDDGEKF